MSDYFKNLTERERRLLRECFVEAFGENGSEKRKGVCRELASNIGKMLKQECKMHNGAMWLWTLGKPMRPLTIEELGDAEAEREKSLKMHTTSLAEMNLVVGSATTLMVAAGLEWNNEVAPLCNFAGDFERIKYRWDAATHKATEKLRCEKRELDDLRQVAGQIFEDLPLDAPMEIVHARLKLLGIDDAAAEAVQRVREMLERKC